MQNEQKFKKEANIRHIHEQMMFEMVLAKEKVHSKEIQIQKRNE